MLIVYRFEEGCGDVGCGYGNEAFDDDGNALLTLITCHSACDSGKASLDDAYQLAFGEMGVVLGHKGNVAIVYSTDDAQTLHLTFWDDEGATDKLAVETFLRIVESEVGEVLVVVNKMLNFLECAVSKEDVGDARL